MSELESIEALLDASDSSDEDVRGSYASSKGRTGPVGNVSIEDLLREDTDDDSDSGRIS